MLSKIKDNLEQMNWLSISILKFGLMLSCSLLIIGVGLQYYNYYISNYTLPMDMGKIAIAIFSEAFIGALMIDYYAKKHGKEQDN